MPLWDSLIEVFKKLFKPLYVQDVSVDEKGWLQGRGVKRIPADPSWGYRRLSTPSGKPLGLVWHWSATGPGTAAVMANKRVGPYTADQRAASWHVSVETDGTLVQMLPFLAGAWHCHGQGKQRLGVELIGYGKSYSEAQVNAARQLVQALVDRYQFSREECSKEHRHFDPDRRTDCGPPWSDKHLPELLTKIVWTGR